jgi:hypothetical protein
MLTRPGVGLPDPRASEPTRSLVVNTSDGTIRYTDEESKVERLPVIVGANDLNG